MRCVGGGGEGTAEDFTFVMEDERRERLQPTRESVHFSGKTLLFRHNLIPTICSTLHGNPLFSS